MTAFFKGLVTAITMTVLATPAMAEWSAAEVRDHLMIEDTMARYMFALDRVDPQGYAETFTEDGRLVIGDFVESGREEIAAYAINLRKTWGMPAFGNGGPEFGPLRHVYYNFMVEVDGDRAHGETYWTTRAKAQYGGPAIIASMGRSVDDFVKIDGQWYFETREIIVDMNTQVETTEGD